MPDESLSRRAVGETPPTYFARFAIVGVPGYIDLEAPTWEELHGYVAALELQVHAARVEIEQAMRDKSLGKEF